MRNKITLISFMICFILSASFVLAAEEAAPSVKATINKKRVFVGDRVLYKIEIRSALDLELEYPQFKDAKIGECEIKDSGRLVRRPLIWGKRSYINWYEITSYYIGKRKLPPMTIKYREKGEGNWKELKTEELTLTVESILPRGVRLYDIKDIKGPIYPFSFLKLAMWIFSGLAIVWLIHRLVKMLRKKAPPKLPHEIALEELESASKLLLSNGDIKEYYFSISDTVRRYIETVFSLRAPEMTTQEFLMSLNSSSKLSSGYKELLKSFMEACDLVKFAKHAPARPEMDSVVSTAKKFIDETKGNYVSV